VSYSTRGKAAEDRRGLAHVEHLVRAYLQAPVPEVVPRRAVTVVLLRDGCHGSEVFLLERAPTMAFAPRQTVFPGGSLEVADQDVTAVTDVQELLAWSEAFGCDPQQAQELLVAAAREVFEESGVLLAVDAHTGAPLCPADLTTYRHDLLAERRTFAEVLEAVGGMLSATLLHPWARWLTPVWSARRYDTYFFLAVLPAGQAATDGSGEASAVAWRTPDEAVRRVRDGRAEMFTPTSETLTELEAVATMAEAMATVRDLRLSSFSMQCSGQVVQVFVERPQGRTLLLEFTR
jgi:8-oxo-dGTP pyrophosphatase MutT (NUDIX family)